MKKMLTKNIILLRIFISTDIFCSTLTRVFEKPGMETRAHKWDESLCFQGDFFTGTVKEQHIIPALGSSVKL